MTGPWFRHASGQVTQTKISRHDHPVVVIDPEDAEQVERLMDIYCAIGRRNTDPTHDLRAALREFAAPSPPKPAEPQGLGAVVEDAEGVKWVRLGFTHIPWRHETERDAFDPWRSYSTIDAVRVLSEGVTR